MSGATKIRGELQAGTSGNMDSSAMETEEYYNPEGGEWSQKMDTVQLCRVCANPNEYLIPIFEGEGLEHKLSLKIEKHLPIKVTETDTLPQHMCYQCASTLIAWHDLVISCVEADKKLKELQADEDDNDDDKGTEMFESHSMDSEPADEVDQPSTSETQSEMTAKLQVPRKTTTSKDKKPKLKMVLVKGGTSGQKTVAKSQVAKALELAKSKEGGNEDSASERCQTPFKVFQQLQRASAQSHRDIKQPLQQTERIQDLSDSLRSNIKQTGDSLKSKDNEFEFVNVTTIEQKVESMTFELDSNLSTSETDESEFCTSESEDLKDDKSGFSCEVCGKIFKKKELLRDHFRIHSGLRPFVCHVCGKQFRTRGLMKGHILRIHEKRKNFDCDICGKKFSEKGARDGHRRSHTGERPLMCDKCGKSFMTYTCLYVHKRSHTDYFPFSCSYCSKKFRTRATLNDHHVVHTGEKPHTCDICGKSFGMRRIMLEHRRIHSGEKPYVCELCGRGFKRREHLKAHGRTHFKDVNKIRTSREQENQF